MVVGFVNAGILNLTQAVGVIMGANIGTTITAWMVSLNQLGDAFTVLQPAFFAPLCIGIGTFLIVFSKRQKNNLIGEIVIGVGLLFVGLEFMSNAINPYTDAPIFAKAFAVMGRNPILGIITGALVTALLQSSTASVGILQTLAMNGVVTTGAAIYITLGQNIGTCLTAMLSSAGANRTAKRAAAIHLTFNTLGAVIFGVGDVRAVTAPACHGRFGDKFRSDFHVPYDIQCDEHSSFISVCRTAGEDFRPAREGRRGRKRGGRRTGRDETAFRHLDQRIFESPVFAIEVAQMEDCAYGTDSPQ